jgi:hypothetical protein
MKDEIKIKRKILLPEDLYFPFPKAVQHPLVTFPLKGLHYASFGLVMLAISILHF